MALPFRHKDEHSPYDVCFCLQWLACCPSWLRCLGLASWLQELFDVCHVLICWHVPAGMRVSVLMCFHVDVFRVLLFARPSCCSCVCVCVRVFECARAPFCVLVAIIIACVVRLRPCPGSMFECVSVGMHNIYLHPFLLHAVFLGCGSGASYCMLVLRPLACS